MIEERRALGLALETAHQLFVFHQVLVKHLDGHRFAERELDGAVDVPHGPGADPAFDPEIAPHHPARQRVEAGEGRVLLLRRGHCLTPRDTTSAARRRETAAAPHAPQSPKQIPRSRAVCTVSESSGTVFMTAMASSIGTGTMWGGW